MQGRDLATLSALDEARMLKQQQEKDVRDRKVEESKNLKFNVMKKDNLTVLQDKCLRKSSKRDSRSLKTIHSQASLNKKLWKVIRWMNKRSLNLN